MRTLYLFTFVSLAYLSLTSQNPITPPGMYIADPEAHVWNDGKLYIYGSRDESDDYWCSYSHHVLSTSNLLDWNVTENAFASKGPYDQVSYHDKLLFAPDCAYSNEKYYLYYCSPGKLFKEGVAISDNPNGPFTNGKEIKGAYQIDPAVLIDDDGQGYYYWGQGVPKVAKLKENLIEIDSSTIIKPLDEKGNKAFHEGSSIRKIGDLYYFIFADESRKKRPTCLGYAIGKSPMGPFKYKGILIDNIDCDPSSWNNHGSIEKFNNQWYVFYHRSSNNSKKFRKACIEPITINKDGTIDEVEMTSQGAGPPLKATNIIQAEWACKLIGNVRISQLVSTDSKTEGLTKMKNDDTAIFKYLSFEKSITKFQIKTTSVEEAIIEIRLDDENGDIIGSCKINKQPNKIAYQISECNIKEISESKRALCIKIMTKNPNHVDIDWFKFL